MRNKVDNVNQSSDATEDDVLELVHAVMHDYRSLQYRILRDGPHDITHMDAKVLGFFATHPGATQSELVEHTGRDKAQLARLIKGLREQALLDAEVDPDDRRHQRLSLTAAGRNVQKTLKVQARRLSVKAVAGLDEHERAQLRTLLTRIKANLASE